MAVGTHLGLGHARLIRPLDSHVSEEPLWHPAGKIAARRLGPYLHHVDQLTGSFSHAAL